MREYISESIVLSREPSGEFDARFCLFTRKFGKLVAKAKSVRKLTSKLAGHLEPGTLILTRLVEKNGLQAVDALKMRKLETNLPNLAVLNSLLAEFEPEPAIWNELISGKAASLDWRAVLGILGWDPRGAVCSGCGRDEIFVFRPDGQDFLCKHCAFLLVPDGLVYI